MVLAESSLLSALGGFFGLGLAVALISMGDPTRGALPFFYFPPRDLAAGVGMVFALGLAAGFFPALTAMRLNVSEAMRRL
jgi:ABC-type antimicrobial peptide transport system permease subunit